MRALAIAVIATLFAVGTATADVFSPTQTFSGPARTPRLMDPWQGKFLVRPRHIGLSGDGSNFMGAIHGPGKQTGREAWRGGIGWRTWTATEAIGTGMDWQDDCKPDCASGHYQGQRVTINAYDVQYGRFTRLAIKARHPMTGFLNTRHRTTIFKLIRAKSNGQWFWIPG